MGIIEEMNKGHYVFRLKGQMSTITSANFEQNILNAIDSKYFLFIVDRSQLTYISNSGFKVLIKAFKKINCYNGIIVLFGMVDYIRELFQIAGLDHFMPIMKSMDDAINKTKWCDK